MIDSFNKLNQPAQMAALEKCCASEKWLAQMLQAAPYISAQALHLMCDKAWHNCTEEDYLQAFSQHPQIGDVSTLKQKFANTANWASHEQHGTNTASDAVLNQLKTANDAYLKKFGYIFIVCATGKTANQMLALLQARMHNKPQLELSIAAAEQNKITHLRLDKMLQK